MNIQERFVHQLRTQALCTPADRILLAVSGGRDSVLMATLFVQAGYRVGIAHCNFGLRGEASDADEALVRNLAREFEVPFYRAAFPTADYAKQQGISIQMAARELRYEWFETTRATQGYDYIAVAQHQSDSTETVLLNLVRGTGLAGLGGIQPKRGRIIRPLLFLTGAEVTEAVAQLGLAYRDDESNYATKYARNKIRLEVVPRLKELNPELDRTFGANMTHFAAAYEVVRHHVEQLRNELFKPLNPTSWTIPIDLLLALQPQQFLLYELFRPFHFTDAVLRDLAGALPGSIPGKQFASPTHVLHVDRGQLILVPAGESDGKSAVLESPEAGVRWANYHFKATLTDDVAIHPHPHAVQLDADKLIFPLEIRSWQRGDVFRPLGMKGTRKLSDFFISLKIPRYQKQEVPLVVNGNGDILWVAPYRMADHYKISAITKKVLTLACN